MAKAQAILVQEEPRGPSQLVEVPVTQSGLQRVPFPDVQQLRSQEGQKIIVKAMRLITVDLLTNGPITGLVNAPVTELKKISLLIYCEGWEKATNMPLLILNDTTLPTTGTIPHRYHQTRFDNWQNVDWSKSFLQYSNGNQTDIGETAGYVILIDVEYVKLDGSNQEIIGPS